MTIRPITLAETDALMAEFLRRQAPHLSAAWAEPTVEHLAAHLQAAGAQQGMAISTEEALACAQAMPQVPALVAPPPSPPAPARAPDWKRPASLAILDRWRQRLTRSRRWGEWIYAHSQGMVITVALAIFGANLAWWLPPIHRALLHTTANPVNETGSWVMGAFFLVMGHLLLGAIALGCEVHETVNSWFERWGRGKAKRAEASLKRLEEWTPTADQIATWGAFPELGVTVRGLLDAPCPPLRLDQEALNGRWAVLKAEAKRGEDHARIRAQLQEIGA